MAPAHGRFMLTVTSDHDPIPRDDVTLTRFFNLTRGCKLHYVIINQISILITSDFFCSSISWARKKGVSNL